MLVTGAARAAFAALAASVSTVGAAAALVGAKAAYVERSTAPAIDGAASAPAEMTMIAFILTLVQIIY